MHDVNLCNRGAYAPVNGAQVWFTRRHCCHNGCDGGVKINLPCIVVVVQEAKSSVSCAMSVIAELAAVTRACAAVSEWHCYRGVIFATRDVELAQRAQREMRQSRRKGRFFAQAPGGTMSYRYAFARSTCLKKTHTHLWCTARMHITMFMLLLAHAAHHSCLNWCCWAWRCARAGVRSRRLAGPVHVRGGCGGLLDLAA